jgi:hypothetical protein
MSDIATIDRSDRPNPAGKPAKTIKIGPQVRNAIEAMVWQGLTRKAAAEAVGLKDNSLYAAFRKPDVKAHYLRELDVLRLGERSRSIHRLTELRDQDDNKMVAFNAAKELAGGSADEQQGGSTQQLPGLVVVVNTVQRSLNTGQPAPAMIEVHNAAVKDKPQQCK